MCGFVVWFVARCVLGACFVCVFAVVLRSVFDSSCIASFVMCCELCCVDVFGFCWCVVCYVCLRWCVLLVVGVARVVLLLWCGLVVVVLMCWCNVVLCCVWVRVA